MRTIRITGNANLKVVPELTKVSLKINDYGTEYDEALAKSVEHTKAIKKILLECGLESNILKTENLYTNESTKAIKDKNGNTTYKHVGYDVTHYLNFTFDNDNELLGKILYKLVNLDINPRVSIKYVVKDSEEYKNELISLAVFDAKKKALKMTNAAGVILGDIVHMDYSYNKVIWESNECLSINSSLMCCSKSESFDLDMTPEDANLTDSVTIEWEIK